VRLADRGLAVEVPSGWEGRIFVPALPPPAINLPVLHLSSVPLPPTRSSFASEAGAAVGSSGTLAALVEFESSLAGAGLFAARGAPPPIRSSELDPAALQVPSPNQGAIQRFFSHADRAFCLYVIAGLDRGLDRRLASLNGVIATLEIAPRGAP
jgi:hypothetical protein